MSLIKQIRIAISFIIMMVAAGCLFFAVYDDHRFMAEQLQKKNNDNANALAITLSNIPKDQVTVELIVSAQFDMGNYHRITVLRPDKRVMIERIDLRRKTVAPEWFKALLPINIDPGVAAIQSGWQQYGTLVMESEPALAYDQLWETSRHALSWTLLVALFSYLVSGIWLKRILMPLDQVVAQAEALGERIYVTIDEPETLEFKKLVKTMNALSERIKQIVTEESARLSVLNQQVNYDELTGLMNQSHFSNSVSVSLKNEGFVEGAFWLVQLRNLSEIDKQLGYSVTNQMIRKIAESLLAQSSHYPQMYCGRLAGGVFGIFSRQSVDDFAIASEFKLVLEKLNAAQPLIQMQFVLAHTKAKKMDDFADIYRVMQFILELSADQSPVPVRIINANSIVASRKNYLRQWKEQFIKAIEFKKIRLERYPVMQREKQVLHYECPLRLQIDEGDQWLAAGAFIDWASQLDMIKTLDILALEYAMNMLDDADISLSINVSGAAMRSDEYKEKLQALTMNLMQPGNIGFEVAEDSAFSDFAAFKAFAQYAKGLGCKVGLEHVVNHLAHLGDLHELGLDYVKFDAALIRDVHLRTQQQSLLRGLCMMVRTMGILPVAEGIQSQEELETLYRIGFGAFTGPYVHEDIRFATDEDGFISF